MIKLYKAITRLTYISLMLVLLFFAVDVPIIIGCYNYCYNWKTLHNKMTWATLTCYSVMKKQQLEIGEE